MKTQVLANPLIASENMQSSVMGMDANGADMATYYLRDKIYSDKILAVVREYVCNALDEHKKHGIDKPVDFGVRKEDGANIFFVRDYAKGLNEDNIRNVFGMYFRSTKSGGNDQIGGFGIGSKAAHSYTDTFYVKSYHGGKCTLYACALGGGNSGVPVGHILKVSETTSSETGLEVSLEIKSHEDHKTFIDRSFDFIHHCSQKIALHIPEKKAIVPETPVYSVERNGFKFRFYKSSFTAHPLGRTMQFVPAGKQVRVSMGDVFYYHNSFRNFLSIGKDKGQLIEETQMIVDIPIGRMTLPISRENFEETPNNSRVWEEIQKTVSELMEEDVNSIAPMTMQQLIDSKDQPCLIGKMFALYKKHKYADVYPLIQGVMKCNQTSPVETIKGKAVCALLPSKASFNYWVNKLRGHANAQNKNYYMVIETFIDECDETKLKEFFVFKPVRSAVFNWLKGAQAKNTSVMAQKFNVWAKWKSNYHWEKKNCTALEVHNFSCDALNLSTAADEDAAKKQMANIYITNFEMLKNFTIYYGDSSDDRAVFTRSKVMKENLLSLGWFELYSPQYKAVYERLKKEESERINRQQTLDCVAMDFLKNRCKEALVAKFSKNLRRANQARSIIKKISCEESLRGKIFKTLKSSGYYSRNTISRKELRTILRLK